MKRDEFIHLFGFGAALLLTGCMGGCAGKTDDPKPGSGSIPSLNPGPIDFTLDVNDPANARLHNAAFGYVYGASGRVIVAKTLAGSYVALAAACTHQGTAVQFQSGNSQFACPTHGSMFDLGGNVTTGPASTPLKSYTIVQTGNVLRITG